MLGPVLSSGAGAVVSLPAIVGTGTVTLGAVTQLAAARVTDLPLSPAASARLSIVARTRARVITAPYKIEGNVMGTTAHIDHLWSPKDPEESESLGFDFSRLTSSVSAPVVTIEWAAGVADANPTAVLAGMPTVQGAVVSVLVQGGIAGADYRLRCKAVADDGRPRVLAGILPVRTAA